MALLRHFFGLLPLTAHEPTVLEDLFPEMLDEAVEGIRLACDQSPHQLNLGPALQCRLVLILTRPFSAFYTDAANKLK
jgi:hypothetical protein